MDTIELDQIKKKMKIYLRIDVALFLASLVILVLKANTLLWAVTLGGSVLVNFLLFQPAKRKYIETLAAQNKLNCDDPDPFFNRIVKREVEDAINLPKKSLSKRFFISFLWVSIIFAVLTISNMYNHLFADIILSLFLGLIGGVIALLIRTSRKIIYVPLSILSVCIIVICISVLWK